MQRRIAPLLVVLLMSSPLFVMFTTAPPAAAVWVCGSTGTARTDSPVFYPTFGSTSQTFFAFSFAVGFGACAHVPSGTTAKAVMAYGTFSGWCGLASGSGTLEQGDLFAWVSVGSLLVLTGHVAGVVNLTPDLFDGENCITGADRFLVVGAIVLLNCPNDLGPGGALDTEPSTELPVLGEVHIWTNGPCVPDVLAL